MKSQFNRSANPHDSPEMNCSELLPDLKTDPRLMPDWMISRDNTKELEALRIAAKVAVKGLPDAKRCLVHLHYGEGLRKTEIASRLGLSDSAVSRGLKAATLEVEQLLQFYRSVYREQHNEQS
ncbi:hypothetical protein U6B65_07450 [Oscillospiraceae bacterium MB08-C2-2]|nr:hypothetical protein U6B65_07450 [Oscillospiraceae bacterium MB08-C2-2]